MTRLYVVLSAAFLIVIVGGVWLATIVTKPSDQFAQCRASNVAGGSDQIGGPFELLNSKGETVTDQDVLNGPSLIYFGYTFCPDVCPLDVARNAEVIDVLDERGQNVTPVFISIDPDRDTPEVVGEFAFNLHERMIGLTGSMEQVKAASRAYKTYFRKQDGDDEYYLVDHSTFSYLVLPEHGFVEFFRRDTQPEDMADQIECFLKNS